MLCGLEAAVLTIADGGCLCAVGMTSLLASPLRTSCWKRQAKDLDPGATRDEKNPDKWKAPADDVFERNADMKRFVELDERRRDNAVIVDQYKPRRSRDQPSSSEANARTSEATVNPWDKQHRYQQPSHSDAASVRQPQSENQRTEADVKNRTNAHEQATSQPHARTEHGAAKSRLEKSRNETDRVNAMSSKMRFLGVGAATVGVFAFFSAR